jgi:hypothetical protein
MDESAITRMTIETDKITKTNTRFFDTRLTSDRMLLDCLPMKPNALWSYVNSVPLAIVEAARDSLAIGQS